MATASKPKPGPAPAPDVPALETVADLLDRLGGVPAHRVLMSPTPGTATEQDVLDMDDHHDRLCELVDGVLVEKPMGIEESGLAVLLTYFLVSYGYCWRIPIRPPAARIATSVSPHAGRLPASPRSGRR